MEFKMKSIYDLIRLNCDDSDKPLEGISTQQVNILSAKQLVSIGKLFDGSINSDTDMKWR